MNLNQQSRVLACLAVLCWILLFHSQTNIIIIASAIAFLTYPFFQRLQRKFNIGFSLIIYYCCLALIVIIPIILITVLVTPQAVNGYKTLMVWIDKGLELPPAIEHYITAIYAWLDSIPGFQDIQSSTAEISGTIKRSLSSFLQLLLTGSISFAGSTINIAMQLFLVIFLAGLAVMYAKTCYKLAIRITALPEECIDRFILAFQRAARSIFIGVFFIAFIQGILTGIGFFLFGVKDAAFWGLTAMICAVIPILGTALIWVPIAITVWVGGSFYSALGIVLWGSIIVAGADSLLRPVCLQKGIKTSIIVLFFAIICSIIAFGPIGLILGPTLVALGIQAVEESDYLLQKYQEEKKAE